MRKNDKDRVTHKKTPRNSYRPTRCVIGFDQSYTRTGISISVDGKLRKVTSEPFKKLTNKSQKRIKIAQDTANVIQSCLKKFEPQEITIIVERIRTYTAGQDLRPEFIKAQGALIATIVDVAYQFGIKVWSVDTRCWKSRILGTSKPIFDPVPGVKDPQKFGSVRKVIDLGFKESLEVRRGGKNAVFSLNDDAADSACIALYGHSGDPYQLIIEQ